MPAIGRRVCRGRGCVRILLWIVGAGHAGDYGNSDKIYASKHGAWFHSRAWPAPTSTHAGDAVMI